MACHEGDENECPYQPVNIKQMIQNLEERHKRDLKQMIQNLEECMPQERLQANDTKLGRAPQERPQDPDTCAINNNGSWISIAVSSDDHHYDKDNGAVYDESKTRNEW